MGEQNDVSRDGASQITGETDPNHPLFLNGRECLPVVDRRYDRMYSTCDARCPSSIVLAKQRNGTKGTVPLLFKKRYAKFTSGECIKN